tara:strand:- start:80 stop:547 length:468 start_codon:yes stop_codon:yes gene_type:complete
METRILFAVLNFIMFLSCSNIKDEVVTYQQISPNCDSLNDFSKKIDYRLKMNCEECKKWDIPRKDNVLSIIKELKTLKYSNFELNDYFNFYDCEVRGEINLNNEQYYYYLNAGGWAILENKKTKEDIYLGCNSEDCRKYFLSIRLTKAEIEGEEN